MDEPDRMLDQTGSALTRALLREGQSYRGPQNLRAHTLAALGLAGSAGLVAGSALAWLSAKSWGAKLLLTAAAVSMLASVPVGYYMLRQSALPPVVPAPRPAMAAAPTAPVPPATPELSNPSPAANIPAVTATPLPGRGPAGIGTAGSALRAELAALDAVRSALANGDSVGALSFLDAYFRTYPRGRLNPEAEVLRIESLARGGRNSTARMYAKEFLRRHPNSVFAARVQFLAGR